MKRILYGAVMISLLSCSQKSGFHQDLFGLADINHANRRLLEVAMEDGFPPPIASRVYVYPHIAHYSTLQLFYPDSLPDFASRLNGFAPMKLEGAGQAHPELTALLVFSKVGRIVVFSELYMDALAEYFLDKASACRHTPGSHTGFNNDGR